MHEIRPRRSVLFMPGANARALEKARTLPCDVVALDLEDAVAPDAKDEARARALGAIAARHFGAREVALRINALSTPWGRPDLAAAAEAGPDAVILPKISGPADIAAARAMIPARIAIWAMIETPAGVLNCAAIAATGVACLLFGSNDLMAAMRGRPLPARENLWAAMGQMVLAARAHGCAAIDGTHNEIRDEAGFAAACAQGRAFGFDGKTLIHPAQIDAANRIFAPSEPEIAQARRILAAFEAPQARGKGAVLLDGRMIEGLHAEEARRLLGLAEAIQARC